MVLNMSSRLLSGSGDSSSSYGGSGSSGQKRKLLTASGQSIRPDYSVSGYSADREESSSSPPMVSIDLDGKEAKHDSVREMNSCPKRQRRNELQFAASSVKADLARAGYEFSTVDPKIESTTTLGPVTINLKGVKLMHSKDFQKIPFASTGRVAGSLYDYQALALACSGSYPHDANRSALSSKVVSSNQDSDRSTSSVSESDTESVTSKSNSAQDTSIVIPPIFNDAVDEATLPRSEDISSCNIISSNNSTVTMCESLALTKTPRLVVLSGDPFVIVYTNAAFLRLSGLPSDKIIGSGFASIIDRSNEEEDSKPMLLMDYMMLSGSGNHKKLQLARDNENTDNGIPVECYAKVLPIVAKKPLHGSEVSQVTHFAVELLENIDEHSVGLSGSGSSESTFDGTTISNIRGDSPSHYSDLGDMAVGVMG